MGAVQVVEVELDRAAAEQGGAVTFDAVEVDHTRRLEPLLRSVPFWLPSPVELATHLEREATYYQELAAKCRALGAANDRGDYGDSPQTQSLRVAAEAGAWLNEALGDWATWARTR